MLTNTIESIDALAKAIVAKRLELHSDQRLLVALAGAPGSGKTTLATALVNHLNQQIQQSVVIPMDGFHLDNAVLDARGQRPVKGAPHTFDVEGFESLLQRLSVHSPQTQEHFIYLPVFDRSADLARNAASVVEPCHRVIIVEGNYLLLNRPGWLNLRGLFDLQVMLDVPLETLETRLVQRWLDHGHDRKQALERAQSNDLPNARLVLQESVQPHLYFKSVRQ